MILMLLMTKGSKEALMVLIVTHVTHVKGVKEALTVLFVTHVTHVDRGQKKPYQFCLLLLLLMSKGLKRSLNSF